MMIREQIRNLYRRRIASNIERYGEEHWGNSALVIAPHPDDETLGCGGTILKKCNAGATVHVVFMTDGSKSHHFLLPSEELRAVRQSEAIAACEKLGVPAHNVRFLAYEDGDLRSNYNQAVAEITALLQTYRPAEIFMPYYLDSHPDHIATNQIVRTAFAAATDFDAVFYEYPVWIWHHWPWVEMPVGLHRQKLSIVKRSVLSRFGWRMVDDFQLGMYIGDIQGQKRAALNEHRTQMTRFLPVEGWYTLEDVAGGEWIDCFFQDYEIFRRYSP